MKKNNPKLPRNTLAISKPGILPCKPKNQAFLVNVNNITIVTHD